MAECSGCKGKGGYTGFGDDMWKPCYQCGGTGQVEPFDTPDLLAAAESALAFLEQIGYHGDGNTPAANLKRAIAKTKGLSI